MRIKTTIILSNKQRNKKMSQQADNQEVFNLIAKLHNINNVVKKYFELAPVNERPNNILIQQHTLYNKY